MTNSHSSPLTRCRFFHKHVSTSNSNLHYISSKYIKDLPYTNSKYLRSLFYKQILQDHIQVPVDHQKSIIHHSLSSHSLLELFLSISSKNQRRGLLHLSIPAMIATHSSSFSSSKAAPKPTITFLALLFLPSRPKTTSKRLRNRKKLARKNPTSCYPSPPTVIVRGHNSDKCISSRERKLTGKTSHSAPPRDFPATLFFFPFSFVNLNSQKPPSFVVLSHHLTLPPSFSWWIEQH